MTRIVIVGGGFAGMSAARALEKRKPANTDVRLVDRQNFMVFTPMLPEAASGSVELRHIVAPFRSSLRRTRFELGEVVSVDERARVVHLQDPLTSDTRDLGYGELILALGSTSSTMGVDGAQAHGLPLRTIVDAQRIRNRVIGALEIAATTNDIIERDRLLRFVIVGGGFTGVEAAGELRAFVRALAKYYPSLDANRIEFVMIQGEERLLPHLPERFGKYAAASLAGRGVRILTGEEVSSVSAGGLQLKSGKRIASSTVVWSAGVEPAPVVKTSAWKPTSMEPSK